MGKMTIVPAVFVLALLISLVVAVQTVKAQYTPDGKGCPLVGNVNITSPSNITYGPNLPTLNITVQSLFGPSEYRFVMFYSIDGENNVTIPLTTTFVPITALRTYENGTTETVTSMFSRYVTAGWVALPELPEGQHELKVYANYECINHNYPALILDSSTVYFTINDGKPPIISNLSLENKTYNQNNLPLNFTTDEPTSWIGYCLDGKTNITIAENTTLTGIANGSHSLTVYANDTAGNMGASETINFTVTQKTELFQTTIVATSTLSVAVVGASLLVYFKKRKH